MFEASDLWVSCYCPVTPPHKCKWRWLWDSNLPVVMQWTLRCAQCLCYGQSQSCSLEVSVYPSMELKAATMASSLHSFWRKEFHIVFWTDSASVLKYINNKTCRFRTTVANWISEILNVSQPFQWRYVTQQATQQMWPPEDWMWRHSWRMRHGCQGLSIFFSIKASGLWTQIV